MKEDNTQVKSLAKAIEIIEAVSANKKPMSLAGITLTTGINKNAVLRILNTLVRYKWFRKTGELYEPDMAVAMIWSRYKAQVEVDIQKLEKENTELEVV